MELVEGEDLAHRLARGAIPLDEALPIAKQIAEALEAAHEQGIIHRDLKPANIKLRSDGTVKVLDFGLAKALDPLSSSPNVSQSPTITTPAMTQAGMVLGTAAYMSPEQARGRAVDKRSDIWSFGCVLFEMLTGQPLFRGETTTDVLAAIVGSDPDTSRVAGNVQRLLRACLEKDPARRLQAVGDAWLLLENPTREPQLLSPRGIGFGVAAAAFALIVVASLWAWSRQSPQDDRVFQFHVSAPPGLVFKSGVGGSAAISPDGRSIAFVAGSGRSSLWIRRLDLLTAHELPGTEGAAYPFWAPDSRTVGFFAQGKLNKVDISGGQPVVITNVPNARGGSWGPSGTIVFGPTAGALQRVAASGGVPSPVTSLDPANGETTHRWPQVLPDGNHVLYFVRTTKAHRQGIYLSRLDRPNEKFLVIESASSGAYSPPHGKASSARKGILRTERHPPAICCMSATTR
jgi:serine/threonine protein kinase